MTISINGFYRFGTEEMGGRLAKKLGLASGEEKTVRQASSAKSENSLKARKNA